MGVREESSVPLLAHLAVVLILPPQLPPPLHPIYPPQAPSSLLEALEQHLASLEGRKLKDLSAASRYDRIAKKLHRADTPVTAATLSSKQ